MFFGSDWLANLYMGCFLFGLIFTSVSLFLNFGHLGGDVGDSSAVNLPHAGNGVGAHIGGHAAGVHVGADAGHVGGAHLGADTGHVGGHVGGAHLGADGGHVGADGVHAGDGAHANGHGHVGAEDMLQGLSPLNLPTLLAFITWFGGAGYIFRVTLGWAAIVTTVLALVSGLIGGAIMMLILNYLLSRGQTPPMRRADYYLPGTRARVISSIAAGSGTGEIVFMKGGGRRVEGARSESGEAIPRDTEVIIKRYENGLAYVQPLITVTDLPPPVLARVDDAHDSNTQPLTGNGPALTRDLHDQTR